jgi:hypothetical protein
MGVKFKLVQLSGFSSESNGEFENELNKASELIEKNDGHIISVQYKDHIGTSNGEFKYYSALIMYNEVPKRRVLTEKTD